MSRAAGGDRMAATVESVVAEFELDRRRLETITARFVEQIQRGLRDNHSYQIPAYVTKIPSGSEKGLYLAVDLGGTNCRVCAVELHGDSTFDVTQRKHVVPADIRVNARHEPLFRFIAAKIQEFLQDFSKEDASSYKLGFTFSFTCEQTSIARGTLVHWDKGWDIPSALGQDPCALLQEALDEIGAPVKVCVLANDAVGTLLTRAYTAQQSDSTLAAIILGTGTNAAYIEKLANITRLKLLSGNQGHMVINTEWGCWDDELKVLPQTSYDKLIDQSSSDPGCGLLEKMVSGMYLGELLRLVLVELLQNGAFDMAVDEKSSLHMQRGIDSSFLSELANKGKDESATTEYIANTFTASHVTSKDVDAIQTLASTIVKRSAMLIGAALAAIIIHSGRLESVSPMTKVEASQDINEVTEPSQSRLSKALASVIRLARRLFGCPIPLQTEASQDTLCSSTDTRTIVETIDTIDIGVDGSLFEFHPHYEDMMRSVLREAPAIGAGEQRVRIQLTRDGSGTGAALIAAVAEDCVE